MSDPSTRQTYLIDGLYYTVRRGDLHPELGNRRRWDLMRHEADRDSAVVRDSVVYLDPTATLEQAAVRFGMPAEARVTPHQDSSSADPV